MRLSAIDFRRDPARGLYLPSERRIKRADVIDARYLFHRRRALRGSGGSVNTSWLTWDEISQSGWGDAGTYICLFDSLIDSTDETGQGVMSGANLVLSQVGGVTAASGSPRRRYVNRTVGHYFTATETTLTTFFNGMVFSYIAKMTGMSATGGIVELYDGTRHLLLTTAGRFYSSGYSTDGDSTWASAPATPTGDFWLYFIDNGTTTYWCWSDNRCSKLSEIPAAQRVSRASINGTQATMSRRGILGSVNTTITLVASVYYVVFSTNCLIDTAS